MATDSYLTIARPGTHEIEIKRSRFLCSLARAADETQAQQFIEQVRARHWDARHHCSAYVVGHPQPREKSNDDGEPGGTAGTPMLEVLRRRELSDTVAVVSRWFGGVLLGAGGLVRAYSGAVSAALEQVGTLTRHRVAVVSVQVSHDRAGALQHALHAAGHQVGEVDYEPSGVRIEVHVPTARLDGFRDWLATGTAGSAEVELRGETFTDGD